MKATTLFRFTKSLRVASTGLLVFAGTALAQEPEPVLDRPTRLSDPAPMLPMTPSPVLESITLFPESTEAVSLEAEIDKHPWKFVLHGNVTATYNDNIFISNSNEQEDFIFTIAPGIAVGRGDFRAELANLGSYETRYHPERAAADSIEKYIFLHYVPSVTLFAQNSDENSFDHDVTLDGQYEWKRLTLGLKARFQTMNLPDIDLGERTERRLFSGALTSQYELTGKTSLELNFYNYVRDYSGTRIDTVEYRGQLWMNYQARPKITLGLGFTYGYVDLSRGPSQSYEQALARLRYRATEKVKFDLTAGGEFRNIRGLANRTNGIFSLGVTYTPFDGTSIYLQGYRRTVTASSSPPANYDVTGVEAQIRQRFARRFYFVIAGGYQDVSYEYYGSALERSDAIFYIRPSLGIDITSWLSCEIGAGYRQNDSSRQLNTFSETTVYLQLNAFF